MAAVGFCPNPVPLFPRHLQPSRGALGHPRAQARVFADVVDITGAVLTKLDGTAKGGIVFRVPGPAGTWGAGQAGRAREGPDDLAPFEPAAFVDALLG